MTTSLCTLISASAGSGKTYQLTRHYIALLRQGAAAGAYDVAERILATTFTRAAAREIIDRILLALAEAVLDSAARAELDAATTITGAGPLTAAGAGRLLFAVIGALHRLRVGTLDAFLIRAALAFAPEIGLPPAWQIAEDAADEELRRTAIEQLLSDQSADDERRQGLVALLVYMNQGRFPRAVLEHLVKSFVDTYEIFLGAAPGPAAWDGPRTSAAALDPAALRKLVGTLAAQLDAHIPTTKKGEQSKNWVKAVAGMVDAATHEDWPGLMANKLFRECAEPGGTYYKTPIPEVFGRVLAPVQAHVRAVLVGQLRNRNRALYGMLTAFDSAYQTIKFQRQAYRFDDFARLLDDARIATSGDEFFYRLDGQIDHLLLDEFQDTSVAQWRFLEPLAREIAAGSSGARARPRSFFCVGDVKQSLYGWRNAERGLFGALPSILHEVKLDHLTVNRRSCPAIIDAVNQVFANVPGNALIAQVRADAANPKPHLVAAAAEWHADFVRHQAHKTDPAGYVALHTCAPADTAPERRDKAIALAAQRVQALLRVDPEREIAVLFRSRAGIPALIERLRRAGISATGEGGTPLTDDAAVCCILSLLHLVDHPSDTAAAFHVASSPLGRALGGGGLVYPSEPAALVALTQRIRRQILDEGLAAVLNGWRQALAPEADGRNLDRLGALVEQALTYAGDPLDLAGFRRQAERLGVEDLSPARVRIITIHASKGREFDAVILPDLDGAFNRRSPTLLTHRAEITAPFDQVTRTPDEAVRALVPELDALYIAQRQRAVVEELCGLYVAMTRAKTTLEMIVQPSTARKDGSTALPASMAGVLRGALVPESPEAPPETCLWQTGSEVAAPSTARPVTPSTQPSGAAPAATPAPAVSVRLALRPAGAGGSLRLRPVVSPSSLEGGGIINLTGALTLGTAKTLDRGSALHRLFECVGWADDPAPDESTLRAALAGLGLPETTAAATPHAAADYLAAFKTALAQPALRAALGRARHRGTSEQVPTLELWRERRFAVPLRDPVSMAWVTVQGQVDRVVVVRGPAAAGDKTPGRVLRALVQDFKSDRLENTGPALREKVEYYRPQLQTYCRAVAALLGIDPGLVAAELLFVTAGVVAPV